MSERIKEGHILYDKAPAHVNYDTCPGIFMAIVDGVLVCNECGMSVTELLDSMVGPHPKSLAALDSPEAKKALAECLRSYSVIMANAENSKSLFKHVFAEAFNMEIEEEPDQ